MINKKIICLALVLVMSLGMAACSSSESKKDDESSVLKAPSGMLDDITTNTADETKEKNDAATAEDTPKSTEKEELTGDVKEGAKETYRATAAVVGRDGEGTYSEYAPTVIAPPDSYAPVGETSGETSDDTDFPFITDPEPNSHMLTAGEWNDNDNWGFFSNLVNTDKITFPSFGIDPRSRTEVEVKTSDDKPVANAKVRLYDKSDKLLWSAVTDKSGKAYLFAAKGEFPFYYEVENAGKIEKSLYPELVYVNENSQEQTSDTDSNQTQEPAVKKAKSEYIGETIEGEGKLYKNMDIMFILDTTGSMGDEMLFLQKEFNDIAEETGTQNVRYSVNFYRDDGDEYVTKCNDFTTDIAALQQALNAENAEGGGDAPEAVDKILEETILGANWNEEAVKIAFLIFDAPPHKGTENNILNAVKAAAEKGIRIIPVVSSNSDRETELFGRALSIVTGGTYVFLTDDSGIGGSHLEPIIGDYDVEKLYDVIVRVINNYKQ